MWRWRNTTQRFGTTATTVGAVLFVALLVVAGVAACGGSEPDEDIFDSTLDGATPTSTATPAETSTPDATSPPDTTSTPTATPVVTPTTAATSDGYEIVTLLPPDAIPAISNPPIISAEVATLQLFPGDLVIGVSINGEHRAYGAAYLSGHEIVNDTLGGRAIAVTW